MVISSGNEEKKQQEIAVTIRKIWSIALTNLQRWKSDQRIWLIFFFTGILIVNEFKGFVAYGLDAGEKCTAYMLPVLFDSSYVSIGVVKTLLFLCGLFLLCDAPFLYRNTPYMIMRSSREGWWMGECLYILLATFLYVAFLAVIAMVAVLPVIQFGDAWGGVLERFINEDTEFKTLYDVYLSVPFATQGVLFPSGAQMYTFLTVWATLWILGMIQYLVNLVTKSMFWGFACAGIFIFLDPILNVLAISPYFEWVHMLSPVCWVTTDALHLVDNGQYLSMTYVICMLIALIVILLFAIRTVSKKVVIEVRKEV